jgi:hypothetical protein
MNDAVFHLLLDFFGRKVAVDIVVFHVYLENLLADFFAHGTRRIV